MSALTMGESGYYTKRQEYDIFRKELEAERSTFESHWRDLTDYMLPRRARFTITDNNKGQRINQKIIDSTATYSLKVLRAGMMSGLTSPARPWFRLTTPDPALAEFASVKDWLHKVTGLMQVVLLRSNFYNVLPIAYGDMGCVGTSCLFMDEDPDTVVRFYPFPIGDYAITVDKAGRVNGFYREFRMSVRNVIDKFGKRNDMGKVVKTENISTHVWNLYERAQYNQWVDVVHVIKKNHAYKPNSLDPRHRRFVSDYYERGTNGDQGIQGFTDSQDANALLREGGYDYFPIMAPRWEVSAEDIYATSCPGMDALGDVKMLQHGEKNAMQAIDKMVKPPMVGDPELKKQRVSQLPGDITYIKEAGQTKLRSLYEFQFRLDFLESKQEQVRQRIRQAFYTDLFLMLAQSDRRQITAREIDERHEEKLLALGPVLEQTNQDLLDPVIDNLFNIMVQRQMLPPPPQELQGIELKVEYISIMAQAQKLVGIAGLDRFTGYATNLMQFNPNLGVKLNWNQMVDDYAEITGVNPAIVKSDEEAEAALQQIQQAQQAQMEAQQAAEMAKAANQMAGAKLAEGDSALDRMLDQAEAGSVTPGVV